MQSVLGINPLKRLQYILMVESGARRFGDMIHVITVTISTGAACTRKRVCIPFLIDA